MGLGHISKVDEDCGVIEKDEEKKPALRLDLACGNSKREGFIGVDISVDTQADYICDLDEYPWRFKKIVRHEGGNAEILEGDSVDIGGGLMLLKGDAIPDNSVD